MINIFDLQNNIQNAVNEAFEKAIYASKDNFVAFLAEGDYMIQLKQAGRYPFVVDYKGDIPYDIKRHEFMCRYLNKHYAENVTDYSGAEGIDNILVEMMIYTHIWESYYFLKHLMRLAQLSIGKDYPWKVEIPDEGKRKFLQDMVVKPMKTKGLSLWSIVEDSYSSYLRNSFAHSRYIIYENSKEIYYGCKTDNKKNIRKRISFDDFQRKFYQSAFLSYYLLNEIGEYKSELMKQVGSASNPIVAIDETLTNTKMVIEVKKGTYSVGFAIHPVRT